MNPTWQWMLQAASNEIKLLLKALPGDVRVQAQVVPILLEHRPSRALVKDGLEVDTLGVFMGPSAMDEQSATPLPPQIILFLDNIWDETDSDERRFRKEVRKTLLHELGHYLGWEESDLEERGLE